MKFPVHEKDRGDHHRNDYDQKRAQRKKAEDAMDPWESLESLPGRHALSVWMIIYLQQKPTLVLILGKGLRNWQNT